MDQNQAIKDLCGGSFEMGVHLDGPTVERFRLYFSELIKWNRRINLVSRNEPDWVRAHFLDSLAPVALGLLDGEERVIDLGAGAGFPGIPLKMVCPDILMVLAEASGRKCAWLRHIIRTLELERTHVLEGRFDEMAEFAGEYDFTLAVSRAAAKPEKVAREAGSFFVQEGRLLIYTTRAFVKEGMGTIYPYHVPGGSRSSSVVWEITY